MGEKRGESKVTLVYGQMNEPPGARARVALTGGDEAREAGMVRMQVLGPGQCQQIQACPSTHACRSDCG
jgi:hypothetical protein